VSVTCSYQERVSRRNGVKHLPKLLLLYSFSDFYNLEQTTSKRQNKSASDVRLYLTYNLNLAFCLFKNPIFNFFHIDLRVTVTKEITKRHIFERSETYIWIRVKNVDFGFFQKPTPQSVCVTESLQWHQSDHRRFIKKPVWSNFWFCKYEQSNRRNSKKFHTFSYLLASGK